MDKAANFYEVGEPKAVLCHGRTMVYGELFVNH